MVTKQPYKGSPGLILGALCIIFRARPVGTGLGAKFGRKPAQNLIIIIIVLLLQAEVEQVSRARWRLASPRRRRGLAVRAPAAPAPGARWRTTRRAPSRGAPPRGPVGFEGGPNKGPIGNLGT